MKIKSTAYTLFLGVISFFFWTGCTDNTNYYLSQGEIFKTSYHIKYRYKTPLDKEIQSILETFDLSLNPFNKRSVIYKINNNQEVVPDSFFIRVFNKAREVSENTGGAFDITTAPLINLWGFGFDNSTAPSAMTIDSVKSFIGYNRIRLNEHGIIQKEDERIQLNASAIAKGYASDIVAGLLDSYGITDYIVEIGGEVVCKGENPYGECWKIEITKPVDDFTGQAGERQEIIHLCEGALATSGNYRNYYYKDGKKYAHTIDPRTGYPAEHTLLSASVIADDCMTADAYATAFMVLGLDSAVVLAEKLPILAYYFVYENENGELRVKFSDKILSYLSN